MLVSVHTMASWTFKQTHSSALAILMYVSILHQFLASDMKCLRVKREMMADVISSQSMIKLYQKSHGYMASLSINIKLYWMFTSHINHVQ